jgi:hypothetical protein
VRQLEAAATATRKLAGRRKLKALPPVPTAAAGSSNTGASAAAVGSTERATAGPGVPVVAEKMPLSATTHGSGAVKQLNGFFAVSRGRQIGEWKQTVVDRAV